jgi:hypothetical protein
MEATVTKYDHPPEPEPGDIKMVIRKGQCFITIPDHEANEPVPVDFIVALGVARSFGDDGFRNAMQRVVHDAAQKGELGEMVSFVPMTVQ